MVDAKLLDRPSKFLGKDEDWQESDETVEEQEEDQSDQESEAEIIDHQTQ